MVSFEVESLHEENGRQVVRPRRQGRLGSTPHSARERSTLSAVNVGSQSGRTSIVFPATESVRNRAGSTFDLT